MAEECKMKNTHNPEIVRLRGSSIIADWNHLFRGAIALDGDEGGSDDAAAAAAAKAAADKAAADKAAADKAAADAEAAKKAADDKPSDSEAKLLKEVMKRKEEVEALKAKLDTFKDINPEEVKSLLEEKKAAEKAKKDAEKKAAEAAGDIERVKQMMADEHKKEIETVQSQLADLQKAISGKDQVINDLTIGQSFSSSKFIGEELVLTPGKAKAIYGQHFTYEDGAIVAYDKPAGAEGRTKLVDARGEPVPFETALKKLVDADPERDYIVKSKTATGANAKPGNSKAKSEDTTTELAGAARISAILKKNGIAGAPKK